MTEADQKLLQHLYQQVTHMLEQVTSLLETQHQLREAQIATGRSVRNLADGLTQSESRQRSDDRTLAQLTGQVTAMAAVVDRLVKTRDPRSMSAEDLADALGLDRFQLLCDARTLMWARINQQGGFVVPLPPPPHELVPHAHERAGDDKPHRHRRKDDSITFATNKDGEVVVDSRFKVKTLVKVVPWLLALATSIWAAVSQLRHM